RDPADLTIVGPDDPEFALECLVVVEASRDGLPQPVVIIGMDDLHPLLVGQRRGPRRKAGLLNEQFGDVRRSVGPSLEVCEAGGFLDQPQPLLAPTQRVLGFLARGYVEMAADRPDQVAVLVTLHLRAASQPARLAIVGADDAELRAEPLPIAGDRLLDFGRDAVAVLRMQAIGPACYADRGVAHR